MRRIFRLPPLHTASKSARNDSTAETAAKCISDKNGSMQEESISLSILFSIQQTELLSGAQKLALQTMVISIRCTHSRHDHKIMTDAKRVLMEPVDLPETSADSVSDNGIADFIGHCETYAIAIRAVFPAI